MNLSLSCYFLIFLKITLSNCTLLTSYFQEEFRIQVYGHIFSNKNITSMISHVDGKSTYLIVNFDSNLPKDHLYFHKSTDFFAKFGSDLLPIQ